MTLKISPAEAHKLGLFSGSRRNKYNNKKSSYNGVVYDSKAEADYAEFLDISRHAKDPAAKVISWERQVRYRFEVNEVHVGDYYLDFLVEYADGRVEHVDVKGVRTGVYKLKKKLMLACHGIGLLER